MAGRRVLIAYGTRYGATGEIALEMAKVMREEGIEPQLLDLGETKRRDWPSLEGFDGVLVGSGIKILKWAKGPRRFLEMHRDDMGAGGRRLGVFVTCLSQLDDPEYADRKYLSEVLDGYGLSADARQAFSGRLDMSPSSRMGGMTKRMGRMAGKAMRDDKGIEFDEEGVNDYRDWEAIRAFARDFARLVDG